MEVSSLSDDELRTQLLQLGKNIGPITGTTRTLYEKQLLKLRGSGDVAALASPVTPAAPRTRTPSPQKSLPRTPANRAAAQVAQQEDPDALPLSGTRQRRISHHSEHASSDDELVGEESVAYYDEDEVEVVPLQNGAAPRSTLGAIAQLFGVVLLFIFVYFLMMRSFAGDDESNFEHEEL